MRNVNLVSVDKEKLHACFKKRDITNKEASIKCGMNPYYISNSITKTGKISNSVAMLLKYHYGIDPDDYAPEVEKSVEPEKTEVAPTTTIDYGELYKVIYGAVYEAMKKALE